MEKGVVKIRVEVGDKYCEAQADMESILENRTILTDMELRCLDFIQEHLGQHHG